MTNPPRNHYFKYKVSKTLFNIKKIFAKVLKYHFVKNKAFEFVPNQNMNQHAKFEIDMTILTCLNKQPVFLV